MSWKNRNVIIAIDFRCLLLVTRKPNNKLCPLDTVMHCYIPLDKIRRRKKRKRNQQQQQQQTPNKKEIEQRWATISWPEAASNFRSHPARNQPSGAVIVP
jgi:hypothetical protein